MKKSPLTVEAQFYAYRSDEKTNPEFIENLFFDNRHDLLADSRLCGIAVKILISNICFHKGVRRNISLTLVDISSRCEVATRQIRVNMPYADFHKTIFADFPLTADGLKACHAYKLVVCDESTSEIIHSEMIHLYSLEQLGTPSRWYSADFGCLRPRWENRNYLSVFPNGNEQYYVRFDFAYKLGIKTGPLMPEVELRLYYPDGTRIEKQFLDPSCRKEDYSDYFVDYLFEISEETKGVFYAELLCMEYPVAAFLFESGWKEWGEWFGDNLIPLDEYSPDVAKARFDIRKREFKELINRAFHSDNDIFAQMISPTDTGNSDNEDDSGNPDNKDGSGNSDNEESADGSENAGDKDRQECLDGNGGNPCPDEITGEESADLSEPLLEPLDYLTGLRSVKEKLTAYERLVRFNKMRADNNLPSTPSPLHSMFLGSPGTGKTTVAKLMGKMLHKAGVLSRGHVVVKERATLLGQNYNSEAEKTLEAIENAQGGILFIDEAHQLHQPKDPRDPGKFVIETLLTALADESNRDWMLILAGYPDEMMRMFDMNPGFKSRIPDPNIYVFDDFSEMELIEIAENYLSRYEYSLSEQARTALADRLKTDYANRERGFGNARHVINLIQTEILPAMASRVISEDITDSQALMEIQRSDIPGAAERRQPSARCIGFRV